MSKRVGIEIDVKFESADKVSKRLDTLIESLSKRSKGFRIDLGLDSASKSFKEFSSTLRSLEKQMSNLGKYNTSFVGKTANEDIKRINGLADAMGKLREKSEINKLNNDRNWQKKQAEAINKNFDSEYKKVEALNLKIADMQRRLNIGKRNSFVDNSVIDNLQKKINSINVATPKKKIKELEVELKNLSSSESAIVRLQNTLNTLNSRNSKLNTKYGSLVGDKNSLNELREYESQILKLKNIIKDIQNGKVIDGKKISSEINSANSSFRDLENSVKSSSNALNLANKDAVSFGSALKQMSQIVGLYRIANMGINALSDSFRMGKEAIFEMDKAMTTLGITMNGMTKTGLEDMVKQSQNLATELSATTSTVLKAVQTYANANESVQSIMDKTSSAVIISNLTGLDIETSVDAIQSATKQFRDLGDGSSESANKVADSMVAISKSLGLDFSKGIKDMTESISIMGSLADQVGMDIDDTLGLIASGMEKLRMSGSEVATAWKTIISRSMRISAPGDNVSEEDFLKAEKALHAEGISIRENKEGMRDYMDILNQVNSKWDSMSEQSKMALGDALGGARQLSIVLASIQNMDRTNELVDIGKNSQGSAMEAQMKWADGLEAKMQSLTNASQIFWQTFINSDAVKNGIDLVTGLINGATSLVDKFGSLSTSVGVLSAAFIGFTNNPIKNFFASFDKESKTMSSGLLDMIKSMKMFKNETVSVGGSMAKTGGLTSILSTGFKAIGTSAIFAQVKVMALQAVMTMGLSFAITGVISVISNLVSGISNAGEKLQEFNNEISKTTNETSKQISEAEKLQKDIASIESKMSQSSNVGEQAELKSKLVELQRELAGILPDTATGYDSEGNKISNNNEAVQRSIDLKKEELKLDAMLFAEKNRNLGGQLKAYESQARKYKEMAFANQHGQQIEKEYTTLEHGRQLTKTIKVDVEAEDLKKLNQEMMEVDINAQQAKVQIQQLRSSGMSDGQISDLFGWDISLIDTYAQGLSDIENQSSGVANGNNDIANAIDNVGDSAESARGKIKGLADEFSNTNDKVSLLEGALKDFKDNGGMLSEDTFEKFFATGDTELIAMLGDVENFEKNINSALDIQKQKRLEIRDETIQQAMASQEAGNIDVNNKINSEAAKTGIVASESANRNSIESGEVNNNANTYSTDVNNKANSENAKMQNTVNAANQRSSAVAGEVNNNASAYSSDTSNQGSAEGTKVSNTVNATNNITSTVASGMSSLGGVYQGDVNNYSRSLSAKLSSTASFVNQNNAMMSKMASAPPPRKGNENPSDYYNRLQGRSTTQKTYKPDMVSAKAISQGFNPVSIAPSKVSGGSGGSSGGGKRGGSSGGSKKKGGSSGSSSSSKKKDDAKRKEEEYQREREKMERDANNSIEKLRDRLVKALKEKYEQMRKKELDSLDKEIKKLEDKLDKLDKEEDNKSERLKALKDEKAKWEQNDSIYAGAKVDELNEQIKELEREIEREKIQNEIDKKEEQKDKINEKYDKLISDQKIYQEANKLLTSKNQKEILKLITKYAPDYAHTGELLGESFRKAFEKEVKDAVKALDYLKGKTSSFKPTSSSSIKAPSKKPSSSSSKKKAKIKSTGAAMYSSSSTKKSSGTWKKAGISTSQTVYIVGESSGRVALSKKSGGKAVGWIDKKNISRFKTGGLTGKWASGLGKLAILDSEEVVLNKNLAKPFYDNKMASVFENLVNMLPKISVPNTNTSTNVGGQVVFNNEFNTVANGNSDLKQNNKNMVDLMKEELHRAGKRFTRR